MESFPGSVWIGAAAQPPLSVTSDEWKTAFFGSATNPLAADNADPDGDGVPNWMEYLAGTNPTNAASVFAFSSAAFNKEGQQGVSVNWLTAPGKKLYSGISIRFGWEGMDPNQHQHRRRQ